MEEQRNQQTGTLRLSSNSYTTDVEADKIGEGTLKINAVTSPAKLETGEVTRTSLTISSSSTAPKLKIQDSIEKSTLIISSSSLINDIHIKQAENKNILKLSSENLPTNLSIKAIETEGNLKISPVVSSIDWGHILGNINNQTDLKNILDTKLDSVPKATAVTFGGIKANAKSPTDVQEVRIDTDTGKLYVDPNNNTYIHEQGIASASWEINHNLNKFPSVTVVDSSNNIVDTAVQYINVNKCILTFNGEFKGKAYLN